MGVLKNIVIAVIVGIILAGIFSQFTTSKYPSCDLVSKGIGVSTFGCSNTGANNEPCNSLVPNSSAMSQCIKDNYYRYKTFPFGFKQTFGAHSNLDDPQPKRNNETASFALGFVLAAMVSIQLLFRKPSTRNKDSDSIAWF